MADMGRRLAPTRFTSGSPVRSPSFPASPLIGISTSSGKLRLEVVIAVV